VLIPAKNEESSIGLCLASLFDQDFRIRKVTVVDDGSTDQTAQVVRRYAELSGKQIELIVRSQSQGKTTAVRELCENSNADAFLILDADTILTNRNYASRLMENLFKNAGVASAFSTEAQSLEEPFELVVQRVRGDSGLLVDALGGLQTRRQVRDVGGLSKQEGAEVRRNFGSQVEAPGLQVRRARR